MKKLLITLGLSVIGFIGFSSAELITFTPTNDCITDEEGNEICKYNPNIIKINETFQYNVDIKDWVNNYNCQKDDCTIELINIETEMGRTLTYDEGWNYEEFWGSFEGEFEEGEYEVRSFGSKFETITLNIPNTSIVGGGNNGGGGDNGNGGSIISSGLSAFSGITEKLGSLTSEFVPYLIYIGIGILGITLIIAVVKYILGYLKGQAMGSYNGGGRYNREGMKERRTQRRRLRRLKKQAGKFEYRYNNYKKRGIDDKAAKDQANYMVKNRKRIGKKYGYRK